MSSSYIRASAAALLASLIVACGGSDGGPGATPAMIFAPGDLSVIEGIPETLSVSLDIAPAADVTVNLSSLGRTTFLPTSFTLTAANFNIPHIVILTPLQDADLIDGIDTVTVTATGLTSLHVPVAIADDDSQQLVVGQDSLTITEGDTASFTVSLAYQPPGPVTVDLAPLDTNITISQSAALFSTNNWDIPVQITVATHHDTDMTDEATSVGMGIAGGPTATVHVAVEDDDSQAVLLDTDSLTIVEGDTASFTVRLAFQPASSVAVDFGPLDSNVTVSQSSAIFTTGNWDTPVRVTVTTHHDTDTGDENTFVAAGIAGGPSAIVYVTVTDDDQQGIQTDLSAVNVVEGADTQLGIRLAFQPAGDFTVNAASLDNTAATLTPSSRTFTTANWDTYQYVTVAGTQDVDLAAASTTARLSGSGVPNKDVSVTVTDDDQQAFVTSVDTVFVTEGLSANVTITLAYQPGSPVSATLSIDGVVATSSVSTLSSFTSANYATGFTVGITGTEDANTTTDGTLLTIQAPGVTPRNIVVIVADND